MRWPYLALAALCLGALVSLAGFWRRTNEQESAPVPPLDGRGWVEGLDGLYGVAREAGEGEIRGQGASNLGGIGYAPGSVEPRAASDRRGFGTHVLDATRLEPGVNLMTSGDRAAAELCDLDGTVLHRWEVPYEAHEHLPPLEGAHQIPWRRVALLEDGGLLAIHDGRALVRIARDSTVVWASALRAHHDLVVDGERIHVLTRAERVVPEVHPTRAIVDDRITTLDLDGRVLAELSLWDAFRASEWRSMLEHLTVREGDVMHANTLELLDGRLAAQHPAFERGHWLTCFRDLDLIAVVDPELGRIVWLADGPWRAPHHPTVTDHGTLLLFDNLGNSGESRLVELEVVTGSIVSSWAPEDPTQFSTQYCGVAQPLANGNVLVTESCRGRAFELTADGTLIWEYISPRRVGPDQRFVAALFEVERWPRDAPGVRAALGEE